MLKRIDIKGGMMTYEQRNDLGELFAGDKTEIEKFKETFRILHNVTPDFSDAEALKDCWSYYEEIIEGLVFWLGKEKELLTYEPEPEEIRAGIRELGIKSGCLGAIKTLAKNYAQDPDDILKWKYAKVFGILYTDLEEFKYQKRLHRQYEKKMKK